MLFNVELDAGNGVVGYLVPDNGAEQPMIAVETGGREILRMACTEKREVVVTHGRHPTGLVGFRFDETIIPELASIEDLTIRDARSGLMIYRRYELRQVQMRVFRLETRLVAGEAIDRALADRFQFHITHADLYGHETVTQSIRLHLVGSVYSSGRHIYRNYRDALPDDFVKLIVVQDPFVELAERLIMLRAGPEVAPRDLGERDIGQLMHAFDWFGEVDLADDRALRRALRRLPERAAPAVRSPLTRQLAAQSHDEALKVGSVTLAVDALSEFSVIGRRERADALQRDLSALFGQPLPPIVEPPRSDALALAERLRRLQIAEETVAEDLVVHHHLSRADEPGAFGDRISA